MNSGYEMKQVLTKVAVNKQELKSETECDSERNVNQVQVRGNNVVSRHSFSAHFLTSNQCSAHLSA